MTTGPGERPAPNPQVQQQVQAVQTVADAHQAEQGALTVATLTAILAVWAQVETADWFGSWFTRGLGERIFVLLALAQESAAADATAYVRTALEVGGTDWADVPQVVPSSFAGRAADGRNLESLLAGAPIQASIRTRRGDSPAVAREAGESFLRAVVTSEVPDAGRAADQVALAGASTGSPSTSPTGARLTKVSRRSRSRHPQLGYTRVLVTPSCSRCIILAGRFYRWSAGFERHLRCDCRHIPVNQEIADEFITDPETYFKSLEPRQQDAVFGKADAEAIRQGASMSSVVNVGRKGGITIAGDGRRYTTTGTRGLNTNGGRTPRPTPWQIIRDAHGNSDEVRRSLTRFGYILR